MAPKKIPIPVNKIFKQDEQKDLQAEMEVRPAPAKHNRRELAPDPFANAGGQQDSEEFSSVEESDQNQQGQDKPEGEQQYNTLQDLIFKLNDQDHSEDQGIQDYKIGGYHPCHVGQVLSNRYVLVQKLGWGHFSTVWLAKDFKFGNYAAVKIMKSSPHYLEASYDEVQILQKVAKNAYHPEWLKSLKDYEPGKTNYDRDDCHVLNLLNSFLYKGPYGNHFCMVFEILGVNLLEVLKRYDYKGLPLHLVKQIARQVLMGLDFLNRICRVIHTDLKPENVLLCLTDAEIKKIVEGGQLANKEAYQNRLRLYRTKYHLGPQSQEDQEEEKQQQQILDSDSQNQQGSTIESRISQITARLQDKNLNKNQRRNLRKKLRKYQEKKINSASQKEHKQKPQKPAKVQKTLQQLFSAFDTKLVLDKGPKLQEGFKVKIADLGNACWQHHHFATQIQTRQYRGPQVLTGSKYNLSADMWSLACMVFEMLTGELLFNPRKDTNEQFGKNDDHLAQMMELLGRFPRKLSQRGSKSRKYFTREGALCRIPKLQNWSMKDVMIAKYRFTQEQAQFFEQFMLPMLNCYPEKRTLAHDMMRHPWLTSKNPENYFMDHQTHERIKLERYDLDEPKDEYHQYESEQQDGSVEDNDRANQSDDDDEFFGYQKIGDIRYIDRSFMDLGYIGYGDGIYLEKLDFGPNWQFV